MGQVATRRPGINGIVSRRVRFRQDARCQAGVGKGFMLGRDEREWEWEARQTTEVFGLVNSPRRRFHPAVHPTAGIIFEAGGAKRCTPQCFCIQVCRLVK